MDKDTLLTTKQAAKYLQVVPITIYRMIDRGDLKAIKVGTRWRVRWEDLQDYLTRSTSQPKEPKP